MLYFEIISQTLAANIDFGYQKLKHEYVDQKNEGIHHKECKTFLCKSTYKTLCYTNQWRG